MSRSIMMMKGGLRSKLITPIIRQSSAGPLKEVWRRQASTSPVHDHNTNSKIRQHRITTTVPFTPAQLFDVVADVDKYKLFLPYCEDSAVIRRPMPNMIMAQLLVGFRSFLSERYTSRIRLDRPRSISIAAIDSKLFNRLESMWVFKEGPTSNSAHVDFTIRFEVANPVASAAIDTFFKEIVTKQMTAFQERCQLVYGNGGQGKASSSSSSSFKGP